MPQPSDLATTNNAYTTTIDWNRFVVEVNGQRGISLRALTKAGLYSRYEDAESAARCAGLEGFQCEIKNPNGGRPAQDFIISDLRSVQKFCMRTRSDVGERIADLIIDHHEEFQCLLSGDMGAHHRLAQAAPLAALESRMAEMERQIAQLHEAAPALKLMQRIAHVVNGTPDDFPLVAPPAPLVRSLLTGRVDRHEEDIWAWLVDSAHDPMRWAAEDADMHGNWWIGEMIGIRRVILGRVEYWTSEDLLKPHIRARGGQSRAWMRWAIVRGYARRWGVTRVNGLQKRWTVLTLIT